jgi:hypothetical protein
MQRVGRAQHLSLARVDASETLCLEKFGDLRSARLSLCLLLLKPLLFGLSESSRICRDSLSSRAAS